MVPEGDTLNRMIEHAKVHPFHRPLDALNSPSPREIIDATFAGIRIPVEYTTSTLDNQACVKIENTIVIAVRREVSSNNLLGVWSEERMISSDSHAQHDTLVLLIGVRQGDRLLIVHTAVSPLAVECHLCGSLVARSLASFCHDKCIEHVDVLGQSRQLCLVDIDIFVLWWTESMQFTGVGPLQKDGTRGVCSAQVCDWVAFRR